MYCYWIFFFLSRSLSEMAHANWPWIHTFCHLFIVCPCSSTCLYRVITAYYSRGFTQFSVLLSHKFIWTITHSTQPKCKFVAGVAVAPINRNHFLALNNSRAAIINDNNVLFVTIPIYCHFSHSVATWFIVIVVAFTVWFPLILEAEQADEINEQSKLENSMIIINQLFTHTTLAFNASIGFHFLHSQ